MRHYLCLILIFATIIPVWAQKQANIWYFGEYAGLDFNSIDGSGKPAVLTDGALATDEGCSVISDKEGNLLFYTDGETVWNRQHQIMPNGTGLHGSYTSTQSALIVPQPGSDRYFYIFTTAAQGQPNGLNYNIIDIYSDDGYGDVITKNIQLYTPTTEKLTAVHHANGRDIWVISHKWESDEFYVYLVTENGLNETPVVSKAGAIHQYGTSNANTLGQMKVSPSGKLIALNISRLRKTEIFDFSKQNGSVFFNNFFYIDIDPEINVHTYGLEFSPNEKYLYIGEDGPRFYSGQNIYQYDISNGILTIIDTLFRGGSLQLAIDNKIYAVDVSRNELMIIERPNLPFDHFNFITTRLSIAPQMCTYGLPNFIQSYFYPPDPVVELPNVFTPNEDDYNERFEPKIFNNVEIYSMDIYSRSGRKVYSTSTSELWWDGGSHPPGVYFWAMKYEGVNVKKGFQKGWVHVFR